MMVAAAKIVNEGHRGDIMLALVADEEFASMGTEEVIKNGFTADGAIIVEPSGLDITIAHRGFVWFEVDIIGQAAHGSRPELGIDAIVKAGKFLTKLGEKGEELLKVTPHPLLKTASMHASLIKGGEELSSYPALCTISVERRTLPGETAVTCEQELREILESIAANDPDFKFEIRTLFQRTTFAVDPTDRIVTTLANKFKEKTGRDATQRGEPFWTDCALLQDAGIPSVLFGVDGAGAHAAVEWTTIDSLEIVTEVLANTIREFVN
jgi:acetylornithine deacetylase